MNDKEKKIPHQSKSPNPPTMRLQNENTQQGGTNARKRSQGGSKRKCKTLTRRNRRLSPKSWAALDNDRLGKHDLAGRREGGKVTQDKGKGRQ